MATQERQTIRQMRALLRRAIAIGIAMAFVSAQANELTCESSHLSTPAPNLEQIARNLAKLRLQIYQMPNLAEKSRANEEFKSKYAEFKSLAGNNAIAEEVFQSQMSVATQSAPFGTSKESDRKEKDQKEREKESVDPINAAHKMIFHEILPGKFMMGDTVHSSIEITQSFSMMSTPVTQGMWARLMAVMGETDFKELAPSTIRSGFDLVSIHLNGIEVPLLIDHPVESVSFMKVTKFIKDLNTLSKFAPDETQDLIRQIIPDHEKGDAYALPTDSQWEYVMRNLGKSQGGWFDRDSDTEISEYGWFSENSGGRTHAVGSLKPRMINGHPFYDLEGNVFEWTRTASGSSLNMIRGGAWNSTSLSLKSGKKDAMHPYSQSMAVGFRLVRSRPFFSRYMEANDDR